MINFFVLHKYNEGKLLPKIGSSQTIPKFIFTFYESENIFQFAGCYRFNGQRAVSMSDFNLCLNCGACCAYFRATFYWTEADLAAGGSVPEELTEKLNNFRVCMKGTNQSKPRCIALKGEIGKSVHCSIYENRASVCRDFDMAVNHDPNHGCNQARKYWGLPPIPGYCPN